MRKIRIGRTSSNFVQVWFTWRGFMVWLRLRGHGFYRAHAWKPVKG